MAKELKVFRISASVVDYGQYASIVVEAKSEEQALEMVTQGNLLGRDGTRWSFEKGQYPLTVELITLDTVKAMQASNLGDWGKKG